MSASPDVVVTGRMDAGFEAILSDGALAVIAALERRFRSRVAAMLDARLDRQRRIDQGTMPDFLSETRAIRSADWQVCQAPPALAGCGIEISGPPATEDIEAALSSNADAVVADFDQALAPTWANVIGAQLALHRAISTWPGTEASEAPSALVLQPRGWHLEEKHIRIDGEPATAALVDIGLFLFHNAAALEELGVGPFFCLPKLESHREARLWHDVFRFAEKCGFAGKNAVRVTGVIETLGAAFEIEEILYELRDYIVALSVDQWDYAFSLIKTFSRYPQYLLPDRRELAIPTHFLKACAALVVHTCHQRGARAISGVTVEMPDEDDVRASDAALDVLRSYLEQCSRDGFDGVRLADAALVPVARDVAGTAKPHQDSHPHDPAHVSAADLLQGIRGKVTEAGLRENIRIAVSYLAAWLAGKSRIRVDHNLTDATTAELARAQIWQSVHHETGILDEGRNVTYGYFKALLREEMEKLREQLGKSAFDDGRYRQAARLLDKITRQDAFIPFLTQEAYREIE